MPWLRFASLEPNPTPAIPDISSRLYPTCSPFMVSSSFHCLNRCGNGRVRVLLHFDEDLRLPWVADILSRSGSKMGAAHPRVGRAAASTTRPPGTYPTTRPNCPVGPGHDFRRNSNRRWCRFYEAPLSFTSSRKVFKERDVQLEVFHRVENRSAIRRRASLCQVSRAGQSSPSSPRDRAVGEKGGLR